MSSVFLWLQLRTTILDGEFIRVFVVAVDVMGNNATDSLVVGVDTTPPRFVKHNFEKNVDSGDPQLPFSSRCVPLHQLYLCIVYIGVLFWKPRFRY